MQSTLLGLAIAIILALVAALVGPFFVDWNRYRSTFESEASRLIGLPVKVSGAIDARILPTPSVRLRGIEVGQPGEKVVQAQSLGIEFGLGALVRGELRAVEMRLVGPRFTLGLDRNGAVDWPHPAGRFDPDAFAIERLSIEDGRAVLADAVSGARLVLEKFWFTGEVRSLAGPFKGEGAFVLGHELYGYRFSTGRGDDAGALRLRLGIDASERPFSIAADGTLTRERGAPRFEGALTLARPDGKAPARGRGAVSVPWRASARIKAGPAAALMEKVEVQYGPDERAIKLAGTAELKFGAHPHFAAVLSARQIDLDRSLAAADANRRGPLGAIKAAADLLGHGFKPPLPVAIGLDVDSMIVGGASLHAVRGDVGFDGKAWTLDKFELRAPGYTQTHFSGRIEAEQRGVAFAGRVGIDANDPRALMAWLEGRSDAPAGATRPLRARGNVTFGAGTFAVEDLHAEFDRETLQGRFAYAWPSGDRPARLDAELRADKLDIDGVLAFAGTALAGTTLARPSEMKLALDIGHATIAGIVADRANARLRYDAKGLRIERLAVAGLGGVVFEASGNVDTSGPSPRGTLILDLDAKEFAGVTALIAKFAPPAAEPFRRIAARVAPAKLRATLNLDRGIDGDGTLARLAANGTLATTRIDLRSEANGALATWHAAKLRLDGRLESDDAKALVALLGLDKLLVVAPGPARLDLKASGALGNALDLDGRLAAGGMQAAAAGKLKLSDTQGVTGALQLAVNNADLRPLRPPVAGRSAEVLPVSLSARVEVAGKKITFEDVSGRVADVPLRGRIALVAGMPMQIDGRIATDKSIDAGALIAGAIGIPLNSAEGEVPWSSAPFAAGIFGALDGRLAFSVARAEVARALTATKLKGVVKFSGSELALEDVTGTLAGGSLKGDLALRRGASGLVARTQIELSNVDAAALLPANAAPALSGRVTLRLKAEGAGLSPQALVGSLAGAGKIALDDAKVVGFDAAAFAAVTQAVDRGLAVETAKVRDVVGAAFDKGHLGIKHMESAITLSAGQARVEGASARVADADMTVAGHLDLTTGGIDLRTTLSGPKGAYASIAGRPDILVTLKGAATRPQRGIDVSALVGWLTLRAVEQQARRVEAAEANRRAPATDKVVRPDSPVVRSTPHGAASEARRARTETTSSVGDGRPVLDRLRPEPPVPGSTLKNAPVLPAPIEVKPLPGSPRNSSQIRGRAQSAVTVPQATTPARANPALPGPSLDELLIRPQH